MHLVSLSGVSKAYDGHLLFDDVSFGLSTSDRVGVLGPNGSGKSTLLRLVAGLERPDAGQVVHNAAARAVHLPQQPAWDPDARAIDVALGHPEGGVREHEAEAMLDRLSIPPGMILGRMSGGQRRRTALAGTLLPASDLLVLDEPTNHLDVDTVDWLEDVLRARASGLLLVTHDRYLLERLVNRMLDIDGGRVHWREGTFSDVLEARSRRVAQEAADQRRRQNLLRKEIAWLRRGPRARTSKPKFRLEQAAALQASAREEDPAQLDLGTGRRRLGTQVLDLEGVRFAYDDEVVLDGIELHLGPGERIGLVGPNGSGKTTLLRIVTGELEPDGGTRRVGQTVEFGVFEQDATVPPGARRVIDTVLDIAAHIPLANGEQLPAARLAERFGFDRRLQRSAVAQLSGGERRRLALLHMLVRAPNVLVLDEPTNDLDLDTLRVLEDHLDGFGGSLLVASHDRFLLDRVTDQLLALDEEGGVARYLDWESYRDDRRRDEAERASATATASSRSARANRERQRHRREIRSLEQRIERLVRDRERLRARLVAAGSDHETAARLQSELDEVARSQAELEHRWLELSIE